MMGIQETLFAFLMMLCGGDTGSDALDYVDSEHYWETKKVEYTVEAMMLEAKKPDVAEDASLKEAQIRKLLAIRALGEKKAEKALPLLKTFTESKEVFVADYAKEAIARIQGKPLPSLDHQNQWKKAVAASPKDASGLVHMKMTRPKDFKTLQKVKDSLFLMFDEDEEEQAEMKAEIEKAFAETIYPVLEQVGNIRAESVTLAFASEFGHNQGWVTLVVQGQYDNLALSNFLNQAMPEEFELDVVSGVPFFTMDEHASMGFVSDNTFVCTFGPDLESQPRASLVEGLKQKEKNPSFSAELQDLLKKTEKSGPSWICMTIPNDFKLGIEFLEPFKNLKLETKRVKDVTNIKITLGGDEADVVKQTMAKMEKDYLNFLNENLEEIQEELPKSLDSMIELMKSIQFKANKQEGEIHCKLPKTDATSMLLAWFYYMMPLEAEVGPMEEVPVPLPDIEVEEGKWKHVPDKPAPMLK